MFSKYLEKFDRSSGWSSDRPIWKFSFNRYRSEENKLTDTDTDTDQKKKKFTDTDADTDMKNF